jgi:predicted nucleic acid-binding protein
MLIDSNIFIEAFLEQDRAKECRRLLDKIEAGELTAFVTDFALHSIAVILERRGHKAALTEIFASLSRTRGLNVLQASLGNHVEIAALALKTGLDFNDAYQTFFAQMLGVPVVSFDHDFDGVVERKTPRELV